MEGQVPLTYAPHHRVEEHVPLPCAPQLKTEGQVPLPCAPPRWAEDHEAMDTGLAYAPVSQRMVTTTLSSMLCLAALQGGGRGGGEGGRGRGGGGPGRWTPPPCRNEPYQPGIGKCTTLSHLAYLSRMSGCPVDGYEGWAIGSSLP